MDGRMNERKAAANHVCKGLERAMEMNHFFFCFSHGWSFVLPLLGAATTGSIDTFSFLPFFIFFSKPKVALAEDIV